ncbi:MAG TPA: hypothetical protein VF466_03745 [Candidatus Saccharimonadales bacterium]
MAEDGSSYALCQQYRNPDVRIPNTGDADICPMAKAQVLDANRVVMLEKCYRAMTREDNAAVTVTGYCMMSNTVCMMLPEQQSKVI